MGIGDSITLISCLGGTMVASTAFLLFLNLVFPRITYQGAARLQKGIITPFFLGLIPAIFLGIPSTILLSLGSIFQFFGSLFYLFLFMWAFLGLAVVSQTLGMHFGSITQHQPSTLVEVMSGVFILTFAIAFPVLGWLVVFPFSVLIGVGATILAIFQLLFGTKHLANVEG